MRLWTVEEANAVLPHVTELVEQVRSTRTTIRQQQAATSGHTNGHQKPDTRDPMRRAVEELMRDGIVLRDPEAGLVDFPAETKDGRRYWLCWVVGEPEVAWWHWENEGFDNRQPITSRPE